MDTEQPTSHVPFPPHGELEHGFDGMVFSQKSPVKPPRHVHVKPPVFEFTVQRPLFMQGYDAHELLSDISQLTPPKSSKQSHRYEFPTTVHIPFELHGSLPQALFRFAFLFFLKRNH